MDLCPNCFEAGYQNGVCRRCGYQARYDNKRSVKSLPAGILLNQRYFVGKVLGEGGFGVTYKAYDLEEGVICAVKEYAPNGLCRRSSDKKSLEVASAESEPAYMAGLRRFQDEARILSRLEQIPSVVDITDTFQENRTAYFVMEFLDGADLRQIVKAAKQRLPVEQVTNIILQVAVSMDVIHVKTKIIHRDISPENIYITRSGKVKLIDFGSAKQTETGMEKGLTVVLKPKFAPPEQFSQEMLQGSFTDVYALAGTYYYALTGVYIPPAPERLSGKNYVPLKQMNLGVPESVSDAVDRALCLNVNQRTRTMQEFISGIAPASGTRPRQVPKQPGSPTSSRQGGSPAPHEAADGKPAGNAPRQPVRAGGGNASNQPIRIEVRNAPRQPAGQKQQEIPYVKVVAGPESGKNWVMPENQTMTVGRSKSEANLRIQYPDSVSRIHCQIAYLPKIRKFSVQDLSGNGTFYKERRLKKGVEYQVSPPARFMLAGPSCVIELGVRYEYR